MRIEFKVISRIALCEPNCSGAVRRIEADSIVCLRPGVDRAAVNPGLDRLPLTSSDALIAVADDAHCAPDHRVRTS